MKCPRVLHPDHSRPPSLAWGNLYILHKPYTLSTRGGVGTKPSCLCGVHETGEWVCTGRHPELMQPLFSSLCWPETWGDTALNTCPVGPLSHICLCAALFRRGDHSSVPNVQTQALSARGRAPGLVGTDQLRVEPRKLVRGEKAQSS